MEGQSQTVGETGRFQHPVQFTGGWASRPGSGLESAPSGRSEFPTERPLLSAASPLSTKESHSDTNCLTNKPSLTKLGLIVEGNLATTATDHQALLKSALLAFSQGLLSPGGRAKDSAPDFACSTSRFA